MSKTFLIGLLWALVFFVAPLTQAQIVHFPDANFKAALLDHSGLDSNGDGEIQYSEAAVYSGTLNVSSKNIADMTGIEAFTRLTGLICAVNDLTSLDVSSNSALEALLCPFNRLTSLDVSSNTALAYLFCNDNQLLSLDIRNGNNTAIVGFSAARNPDLSCINVSDVDHATKNWTSIDDSVFFDTDCGFAVPVIISDGGGTAASVFVNENQTAVTTVEAVEGSGDGLSYSITGGADQWIFVIDSITGELTFSSAPDYEAFGSAAGDNAYLVEVTAANSSVSSLKDIQTITVNVQNINDNNPVITSNGGEATASIDVDENQVNVTSITTIDADGDGITYSISGGADQAKFTISEGVLRFEIAPDYEANASNAGDNAYVVEVTASDDGTGNLNDVQIITVNVQDVFELAGDKNRNGTIDPDEVAGDINDDGEIGEGEIAGDLNGDGEINHGEAAGDSNGDSVQNRPVFTSVQEIDIFENQQFVLTVSVTEADGDDIAFSISGGSDGALFAIDPITGALTFLIPPDFEVPHDADGNNTYVIEVTATDNGPDRLNTVQIISININDVEENRAPEISSGPTINVMENELFVMGIKGSDQDGDICSFEIVGGVDAGWFDIDRFTGELSFVEVMDYENPGDDDANNIYEVEIMVADPAGLFALQSIEVHITDDPEQATSIKANNLVTPNGDGRNDTWEVENINELQQHTLYILNNLGEVIYQAKPYNNNWEGYYKGKEVTNGTYYYMFVNGNSVFKGTMTITR